MMAPGGQHVGAAIILRSAVAKKLWGDDPSARAELAAEAEVKELLEFAGLSADSASVLSDVLEEGQRSMGPFISQMTLRPRRRWTPARSTTSNSAAGENVQRLPHAQPTARSLRGPGGCALSGGIPLSGGGSLLMTNAECALS